MVLQIVVIFTLAAIAVEDFKSRAVHLYWFIILFGALLSLALLNQPFTSVFEKLKLNIIFCLLQFALLNFYYCIKARKWVWIFDHYLGWGDVIFILCITTVWGLSGFIIYMISSLLISLLTYLLIIQSKSKQIPLAGLQAICLVFFLLLEWNGVFDLDYVINSHIKNYL